jgi:hypothetical protein
MLRYSGEIERNFDVSRSLASSGEPNSGSNGESANMGDGQPTIGVRTAPAAEASKEESEEFGKRSKEVVHLRIRTLTRPEQNGLSE